MELKPVRTQKAPAAIGPYSQGIIGSSFMFVSGQLGLDPQSGEFVGKDLESQARQSLKNLSQILSAGGSDINKVLAVDVFLTDIKEFARFNEIYTEFFTDHHPARAVVEVCALPKNALVEIKCIAAV